jgi:hypothetical protein
MAWAYGDVVLYRYGLLGEARFVRVARVIRDDGDGLVLWIGPGSPQIETVLADGRGLREVSMSQRLRMPRKRRLATWRGPGIVVHVPPAGAWSVWWFFHDDGRFAGWYGNLEAPQVRWQDGDLRGVDTTDRALDVLVSPDRTGAWKDEDEFAALTGQPGRWTQAQVPEIRATGEQLMAMAGAGQPPFDGRFTDYRPDPEWAPVVLPDGWDRPLRTAP